MPSDLASLIKRAREKKGWTQAELSRQVNVTRQTVADWEKGRSAPNRKRASAVALALNLPLAAIAGDPRNVNVALLDNVLFTTRRVPLLDWVDAGRGAEVATSYVFDGTHEFIETTFPVRERAFALEVRGKSMEPDFKEGDIIVVDPSLEVQSDDFVVAEILPKGENPGAGECTFKQYRPRGPANGSPTFDLLPVNPDFPAITVNKSNPGRIVGIVVEHRRRLSR